LKILKFDARFGRIALVVAALLCVVTAWFFAKWNFANAVSSRLDTRRAEFKPIADWLTVMAPGDSQTHLTAARIYQRTFDTGDLTRSLREYETAAALSPSNFFAWVELGKARNLNGDADGAEAAFARALELAPNYSAVQWAYGNALIRLGKTAEGFALIAKAAAGDANYSQPAVTTALQVFDNDVAQVRRQLGDTDTTNAALALVLASDMHFEDAYSAWSKLPEAEIPTKFKELGAKLTEKIATAKKFRLAAGVAAAMRTESDRPAIGQLTNGGFEAGVKLRNAGLFEWQIADGVQPQIGLSETQPHGGKYSLLIIFNSFETAAFRDVSQTVAVAPGAAYEFEAFYRSDLKTLASIKIEVVNALTAAPISSTPPIASVGDWMPLKANFTVPSDTDGIMIRLVREGCAGPSCPMNGSLALDDLSLRRL
jgi:tetratricopeptide (TPR) repeat protein